MQTNSPNKVIKYDIYYYELYFFVIYLWLTKWLNTHFNVNANVRSTAGNLCVLDCVWSVRCERFISAIVLIALVLARAHIKRTHDAAVQARAVASDWPNSFSTIRFFFSLLTLLTGGGIYI